MNAIELDFWRTLGTVLWESGAYIIIICGTILGMIDYSLGRRKRFRWEEQKHNFFPYSYNWDSPAEQKQLEKLESMERMQRQLWYKEFFKD